MLTIYNIFIKNNFGNYEFKFLVNFKLLHFYLKINYFNYIFLVLIIIFFHITYSRIISQLVCKCCKFFWHRILIIHPIINFVIF